MPRVLWMGGMVESVSGKSGVGMEKVVSDETVVEQFLGELEEIEVLARVAYGVAEKDAQRAQEFVTAPL